MVALAYLAYLAFFALNAIALPTAYAQEPALFVDVANHTHGRPGVSRNHERFQDHLPSSQQQLLTDLHSVKADALVLYTNYASRAGKDLKIFLNNVTGLADEVIKKMKAEGANDTSNCWTKFEYHLKKIEHDARRAAIYSGDSHHKFILGHMIVFRMHLNKSDDYLKKSEEVVRGCGLPCESNPRVKRWRRLAMEEIHRVRDDIQHTKKAYRDLVSHARRKLNHLKKQALNRERETIEQYYSCKVSEQ